MSRRKEANRAEAIVRGVGALILLLLIMIMIFALPHILKGKSTQEMMDTMMHMIVGFAVLVVITEVIGLIVWVRVENPQARGSGELSSIASSRKSAEHW